MSGLEKQIEDIADKAALKAYIEALPDGVRGVILTESLDEESEHDEDCEESHVIKYKHIGDITMAQSVYLVRSYEHWVFGDME